MPIRPGSTNVGTEMTFLNGQIQGNVGGALSGSGWGNSESLRSLSAALSGWVYGIYFSEAPGVAPTFLPPDPTGRNYVDGRPPSGNALTTVMPAGFELVAFRNSATGYQGVALYHAASQTIVIVNAGTNDDHWNALGVDVDPNGNPLAIRPGFAVWGSRALPTVFGTNFSYAGNQLAWLDNIGGSAVLAANVRSTVRPANARAAPAFWAQVADAASMTQQAIGAVQGEQRILVVGHSLGGAITEALANEILTNPAYNGLPVRGYGFNSVSVRRAFDGGPAPSTLLPSAVEHWLSPADQLYRAGANAQSDFFGSVHRYGGFYDRRYDLSRVRYGLPPDWEVPDTVGWSFENGRRTTADRTHADFYRAFLRPNRAISRLRDGVETPGVAPGAAAEGAIENRRQSWQQLLDSYQFAESNGSAATSVAISGGTITTQFANGTTQSIIGGALDVVGEYSIASGPGGAVTARGPGFGATEEGEAADHEIVVVAQPGLSSVFVSIGKGLFQELGLTLDVPWVDIGSALRRPLEWLMSKPRASLSHSFEGSYKSMWEERPTQDVQGVSLNNPSVATAGWIGGLLGSTLGAFIVEGDDFGDRLASGMVSAVGARLGTYLFATLASPAQDFVAVMADAARNALSDFGGNLAVAFDNAAIGSISTFLSLEVGEALGLDGFGQELTGAATSAVLRTVLENAAASQTVFSGFADGTIFAGTGSALNFSIGSFIGAKLGSLVVQPNTQAGAILSSIGAAAGALGQLGLGSIGLAVGNAVATGLYAAGVSSTISRAVGYLLIPGIGAFIGFVLGAFIGNLFGRKKPRIPTASAEVYLQIPSAQYALGSVSASGGGNIDLVRAMGEAARDTLNGLIAVVTHGDDAARVSNSYSPSQYYGHTGGQLWIKYDSNKDGVIASNEQFNVNSADEAVDKGVLFALPATQIVGGDLILKRALYNMIRRPGQVTSVAQLTGDLQIAEDYGFYLQNRAIIDAMIAEPYTSMKLATLDYLAYVVSDAARLNAYKAAHPAGSADADPDAKNLAQIRSWGKTQWDALPVATQTSLLAANSSWNVAADVDTTFYDANKAFMTRALAKEQVALTGADLTFYNANKAQIDRIISRIAVTQFAAAWIITLQRAAELELNRAAASDFYGGAKGFIDGVGVTIAGAQLDYERALLGLQTNGDLKLTYAPLGVAETQEFLLKNFLADVGYATPIGVQQSGATAGGLEAAWAQGPAITYAGTPGLAFQVATFVSGSGYDTTAGNDFWRYVGGAPVVMDDYRQETYDISFSYTYEGGEYPETLYVTERHTGAVTGGDDIFISDAGNDTLNGRAGHDWLDGGAGNDQIYGGDGHDVLLGKAGADTLNGELGDDVLLGGDGDDTLNGGPSTISAGQLDNDLIHLGGGSANVAFGGAGDDTFYAEAGGGTINGATGSDTISYRYLATANLGGTNDPTSWVSSLSGAERGVYIDRAANLKYGAAADDALTSVENLEGSRYADWLKGDVAANVLKGLEGKDYLYGHDGNDTLEGGAGADVIDGGAGTDTLSYKGSSSAVWVDLTGAEFFGGDADGDVTYNIEHIEGSKFADTFKGTTAANTFKGGAGDDWFIATPGADAHYGDDGFDTIDYSELTTALSINLGNNDGNTWFSIEQVIGTNLNDYIVGAFVDDYLRGGKGDDTINGNYGNNTYLYGLGDGVDTIVEFYNATNAIVFDEGINWSNLRFTTNTGFMGGSAVFKVGIRGSTDEMRIGSNFGSVTNNKIKIIDIAGAGAIDVNEITKIVNGGTGADTVQGTNSTRDLLVGYEGADTIRTTAAGQTEQLVNVVLGGLGNDVIYASNGDDQFVFERGDGFDTITDTGGEDTIVFGPSVAAEDVIFERIAGSSDLWIGVRDVSNPTLSASQVADRIKVVGGGVKTVSGTTVSYYNTVEFVRAGGTEIDLRKLDINWRTVTNGVVTVPPIVFDLGGDGVDLTSVDGSLVAVQGGDGSLRQLGWVDGQDGLLAIDRNGDGAITQLSEISFLGEKQGAATDLEGLAGLDSNGDGVISNLDARWGELKLWRDVNANGRGFGTEVVGLDQAGIVSISLSLAPTGFGLQDTRESVSVNTATFTWADGRVGTVHDVLLGSRTLTGDAASTVLTEGELGRARLDEGGGFVFERADDRDGVDALPDVIPERASIQDVEAALAALQGAPVPASAGAAAPVVIDMDGDGIELVAAQDSRTYFDLDADGFADRLGWVGASDAILALDRDGDGLVKVLSEISFVADVPGAQSDLEGLAAFDTNANGLLDAGDARFNQFLLWNDANQDGQSTYDEVRAVSEAGLVSLDLTLSPLNGLPGDATSNVVLRNTAAHFVNGVRQAGDVLLGSQSGLLIALQGMEGDAEALSRPGSSQSAASSIYAPHALSPELRRSLLKPSDQATEAGRSGGSVSAEPNADASPAETTLLEPAVLASRGKTRTSSEQFANFRESMAQGLVGRPDGDDQFAPADQAVRRNVRRWWAERHENAAPSSRAGLGGLMRTLASTSIVDREGGAISDDRTIAATETRREVEKLVQAVAGLGAKSGGEARQAKAGIDDASSLALPSVWRRPALRTRELV